jgi:hypothetical protein
MLRNYPILLIRSIRSPFLSPKILLQIIVLQNSNKSKNTTAHFYVQLMLIELIAKSNSVFIGSRPNKNSLPLLLCKNTDHSLGDLPDWPGLMARFCRKHFSLFFENPILNGAILAISETR